MKTRLILLCAALIAALTLTARASTRVTVDTSGLIGNPAGPFYLDFQFNDGTGAHDNMVKITDVNFYGGSAIGAAELFGGASGDLLAGVTLTDSNPFNEFYQQFMPGTLLTFQLTMTSVFAGPAPDVFGFAILDANLFNLATYSWGSDQLLIATLNNAGPAIETFATIDGSLPPPHVPDGGSTFVYATVVLATLGAVRRKPRQLTTTCDEIS